MNQFYNINRLSSNSISRCFSSCRISNSMRGTSGTNKNNRISFNNVFSNKSLSFCLLYRRVQ